MNKLKCLECNRYIGYTEGKDTSDFKKCPQRKPNRAPDCEFYKEFIKYTI